MLICYGLCGSFCTLSRSFEEMKKLKKAGHQLLPVGSFSVLETDTRFMPASEVIRQAEEISGKRIIANLADAEPIGPIMKPDIMIIAPLTGNSLAKLAHGIYDTPVTLAAKAHLRNCRPLLLGLCTNDALSGNFKNIAELYTRKNIYFLPLYQDDPKNKPHSLVCRFEQTEEAMEAAKKGKQLPLFA